MKVLIHTDSRPTIRFGGPGKFCPGLHASLLQVAPADEHYLGSFADQILSLPWYAPDASVTISHERSAAKVAMLRTPWLGKAAYRYKHRKHAEQLIRLIEDFQPDVIHCHDFSGITSVEKIQKPVVFTNHFKGSLYKEFLSKLPEFSVPGWEEFFLEQEKTAISRADVITFPSESAKQLLLDDWPSLASQIKEKSKIVYSGIADPRANLQKIPQMRYMTVMNVANHIHDKGIDIALRVFAKIRLIYPGLKFRNFGAKGAETPELKRLTSELGIESAVEWMGPVAFDEIVTNFHQCAMLIHSPRRVVFDLSLLEAMACEIPILASNVLGNVEALGCDHNLWIDHATGELTDTSWIGLDLTSHFFNQMGERARQRCREHFSLKTMANNYRNLYLGLIGYE